MARRIPPQLLVGFAVVFAVAVTLGVVYLSILAPQLKTRRRIQKDLESAKAAFTRVQTDFGRNADPQAEILLLQQEIGDLEQAVASLDKISAAKLPNYLFPQDLATDDLELLRRRYRDHLTEAGEAIEERVEDAYDQKNIRLDVNFKYPARKKKKKRRTTARPRGGGRYNLGAVAAARGSAGAGGVTGNTPKELVMSGSKSLANLIAQEDLCMLLLEADVFALEKVAVQGHDYTQNLRVIYFDVEAELSTQGLVRLAYLMRDRDEYYFFEDVDISPTSSSRGSRYFDPKEFDSLDELLLKAKITTIRYHVMGKETVVDRRAQAKAAAAKAAESKEAMKTNVWFNLMGGSSEEAAEKFGEVKPWWQFW